MQFKSTTILPTPATLLPLLIATNTTSTSYPMLTNQLLKKSDQVWTPKPGTPRCNSDSTTPSRRIATRISNGALIRFNPISINVAATGALLVNSNFMNDPRV
ncbi:hypothetical protein B9Z19DRAFT_1081056 [Tuber borchii]|uniref:Uncharacterized protein n=1 Tax=Tuber borchii TaxID=42251 RepID=A0A2T6ZW43_TUBBO|nr:hypothetical protein B9Z19DRAFT_1081056 [Tuber borchii]